jgi:signal peptidase I
MKLWNGRDKWQVGDVVVFKDPRGNHSCKRIIGIEGDKVDKRGQYVHLYQDEQDLGIRKVPTIDVGDWEEKLEERKGGQGMVIVVPKGTVWVEGDNPLFSVDSRHYGPISNDSILGKVVYRLWPRHRNIEGTEKKTQQPETKWSCLVNPKRPHPMKEEEMFSGLYNIAKIPVKK